jgi:hypothetical protein
MAYTVDVTKGQRRGELSHQWASRPDDQRFLSLEDLYKATDRLAKESFVEPSKGGSIEALHAEDGKGLYFRLGDSAPMPASNIAFRQIASFAGAPASYLEGLPAGLAALNLNYGLTREIVEEVNRAAYVRRPGMGSDEGQTYVRGFTSPNYGRIYDRDIVAAMQKLVEHDPRWKVPGTIDWSSMMHDPNTEITKESTTLYASDRDVFAFLCDDRNPVEVGKLANGEPDYLFRGFYVSNSEIGYSRFSLCTMYLRGVCQNRNLWGVEGFKELRIRHTKGAPQRFIQQAEPTLAKFATSNTSKLVEGVKAAKGVIVGSDQDEREEFLRKLGFSKKKANEIIDTHVAEEGKAPESIWEMAQGITALARNCPYQDQRVKMEWQAGELLDKVAVPA